MSIINKVNSAAGVVGLCCLAASNITLAVNNPFTGNARGNDPVPTGNCAELPADRATEFHGNPYTSELNLAMAGNQWVVFNKVMKAFNERRVANGESDVATDGLVNKSRTLEELRTPGNNYFIELIPPGQERDQIKSGCMLLGNDEGDRNFLPFSIQTNFDVFTSTNYNLMRNLATSGYVKEAIPYIRNQLTLMTDATNSTFIGVAGTPGSDEVIDATLDLLDSIIEVSQVDHINEGIHRGINAMYQRMDEYTRLNGTPDEILLLDERLADVADPQPGSPAETRTIEEGITTNFNLATNAACHYSGHPTIADGTLRLCEYAVLNKSNTHETRVHHVETPERILADDSDVGPVWVSELKFAQDAGDAVSGSTMPDEVNVPVVYSVAFLATLSNKHRKLAEDFVDFLLGDATQIYVDGGFLSLAGDELAERYSLDKEGNLIIEQFVP
jgi:ABC-type molybdate transport system substrate-binding protein